MATHQRVAECSAALADATSAQKEAMTQMKGLRDTKARCHDELLTAMKQAGIESVELPSGETLHIEERLRTLSMCVCAGGVIGAALCVLRSVLVPLVLAVALSYLLVPLIDALSVRPLRCFGRLYCTRPAPWVSSPILRPFMRAVCLAQLPRWLATCVALAIAFAVRGLLGSVVADSVHVFAARAELYSHRVETLLGGLIDWMKEMEENAPWYSNTTAADDGLASNATGAAGLAELKTLAKKVPVTQLILSVVTSLLEMLSNLFLDAYADMAEAYAPGSSCGLDGSSISSSSSSSTATVVQK
mgnify:CR=1 FL=1